MAAGVEGSILAIEKLLEKKKKKPDVFDAALNAAVVEAWLRSLVSDRAATARIGKENMEMTKQTKKEESEQLLLGTAEDGFIRPLRETDRRYIEARKKYAAVANRVIAIQEEIKEIKEEALAPVKDTLKGLTIRLGALEQLYAYRKIQCFVETARIQSLEENAEIVVCVVSQKLAKTDWAFVCSMEDYLDKCRTYGTINVFRVAAFANGKTPEEQEEEAKSVAPAAVPEAADAIEPEEGAA
jgi:hypothetical protein